MRRVALVLLFLVCHVAARAVPAPYQRAGQAARSASAPYQREGRAPARPCPRQQRAGRPLSQCPCPQRAGRPLSQCPRPPCRRKGRASQTDSAVRCSFSSCSSLWKSLWARIIPKPTETVKGCKSLDLPPHSVAALWRAAILAAGGPRSVAAAWRAAILAAGGPRSVAAIRRSRRFAWQGPLAERADVARPPRPCNGGASRPGEPPSPLHPPSTRHQRHHHKVRKQVDLFSHSLNPPLTTCT